MIEQSFDESKVSQENDEATGLKIHRNHGKYERSCFTFLTFLTFVILIVYDSLLLYLLTTPCPGYKFEIPELVLQLLCVLIPTLMGFYVLYEFKNFYDENHSWLTECTATILAFTIIFGGIPMIFLFISAISIGCSTDL
jgi:hypothetical protein